VAKRAVQPDPAERPALAAHWPASEIVFLPIKSLAPHARNARMHSPEQVQQIADSMREFGWVNPVLVDEERILIAGHGRVLAADGVLGWAEAPATIARGWSDVKKRAYMIADNKIALNATWDPEMLDAELRALDIESFAADLLGFSDDDLARLEDDLAELRLDAHTGAGESEPTEVTTSSRLGPDQVTLSVPLTVAERGLIFEAIAAAKIQFGIEQGGPALCQICKLYLNRA
jgi:hypothetical protein